MVKLVVLILFVATTAVTVRRDQPTVATPPLLAPGAPAPLTASGPVFDPDGYVADCIALADDWRQLQQLEQEISRP